MTCKKNDEGVGSRVVFYQVGHVEAATVRVPETLLG